MKINIEFDEVSRLSNKTIMKHFDVFMNDCCESKGQKDYEDLIKKMGKYLDEAREGYGIKYE
jgi:hypothetical protein